MDNPSKSEYHEAVVKGDGWTAMLGDSCERLKELATDSVDLSVYSPPFADLYTYTDSEQKSGPSRGLPLGNSAKHMTNATLDWQTTDRFNLFLSAEVRSKRYRGVDAVTGAPQYWKDYEVFHLGAAYKATDWLTINARINNLLDRDFTSYEYSFVDNNDGTYTLSAQDDYNNKDKSRNLWLSLNVSF